MCLGIVGRIVTLAAEGDHPDLARVEVAGLTRNINVGILRDEKLVPGDWILIHVGFALSKIDEVQAHDQLRMLRAMGEEGLAIEEVRGYSFAEPGR